MNTDSDTLASLSKRMQFIDIDEVISVATYLNWYLFPISLECQSNRFWLKHRMTNWSLYHEWWL